MTESKPARASFYIPGSDADIELVICRILDKAWSQGHRIWAASADPETLARLDRRLWTFRAGSFLPHERAETWSGGDAGELPRAPVWLGPAPPPWRTDLIVALHGVDPTVCADYERIVEIVPPDPAGRAASRARARDYKRLGVELAYHQLTS